MCALVGWIADCNCTTPVSVCHRAIFSVQPHRRKCPARIQPTHQAWLAVAVSPAFPHAPAPPMPNPWRDRQTDQTLEVGRYPACLTSPRHPLHVVLGLLVLVARLEPCPLHKEAHLRQNLVGTVQYSTPTSSPTRPRYLPTHVRTGRPATNIRSGLVTTTQIAFVDAPDRLSMAILEPPGSTLRERHG